ncbi:MAG: EAL domain-containing protein [Patulibacter minatonensis]
MSFASRIYAALGLALLPITITLTAGQTEAVYVVTLGLACLACADRARRERAPRRLPWALFAAGLASWSIGEVFLDLGVAIGADGPTLVDAFFLLGYPFYIASVALAARMRSARRDLLSWIDGLLVAVAASVPLNVFWIAPTLQSAGLAPLGAAVALTYPLMDLLLLACAVRFVLGDGAWPRATVAFMLGIALVLASDTVFNLQTLSGTYTQPSLVDLGWIAAYVLWGACALRPTGSSELARGAVPVSVQRSKRAWILALSVALPLGVVAKAYVDGSELDAAQIFVPLAVIAVLTIVRLRLLARRSSTAWQGVAILSATAILTVAVAYAITSANAGGRHQEAAAVRLEQLKTQVERSDSLIAWTLTVQRDEALELMPRLVGAQLAIRTATTALDIPEEPRILALSERYDAIASREFDVLQRSNGSRALRTALLAVMPARNDLLAAVQATSIRYRSAAESSARHSRVISVVVLALALSSLWVLMLRFGVVSRLAESAQERSRAVRESEDRMRALLGASTDLLTVVDPETRVLAHADQVARMFDLPDREHDGLRLDAFLDERQSAETHAALAGIAGRAGEGATLEWTVTGPDGAQRYAEVSAVDHTGDPRIGGIVLSVRDVTERRRLEAALEHQALHDPLTGLANRALVTDRLTQLFAHAGQHAPVHALVMLDLDDFRAMNDAFGHPEGDQLLKAVAARFGGQVREHEALARVGGDGFALLVENVGSEHDARARALELLGALDLPIRTESAEHLVRASVGIALGDGRCTDDAAEQARSMFRDAELAMYEAKREEGNSAVVFAPHMHEAVTQRLALRAEMVVALQREEFFLHYQPIVEIRSRRVVGYEALVRWSHPERGMVSPGEFIPVAEQSGLIVELGDWVLREATRQLAEWQEGWSDERYISVNVAGQQLERPEHLSQVQAALAASGLAPHQLLLEVTESSLINDTDASVARLEALRQLGVRLAIDDFGTGYSSLNYLHRFAVDVLKIDKSFIDDIEDGGRGRALVDAIIAMARGLGLTVVAEGIEERGQVSVLAAMDCALGQGFHFSRPLPAADVPEFETPGSIRRVA